MAIKVALALFSSATGSGGIDKSDVSPTQVSINFHEWKKKNQFFLVKISLKSVLIHFSNEMENNTTPYCTYFSIEFEKKFCSTKPFLRYVHIK